MSHPSSTSLAARAGLRALRAAAAALLGALLSLSAPAAGMEAGTIEAVGGEARVVPGLGMERPAVRGDVVRVGDLLVTRAGGSLELRMRDDARIWLRPDSRLRIEQYLLARDGAPRDQAALQLLHGTLRQLTGSIGKASPGDWRMSTLNAVLGIRGTEFDLAYVGPQASVALNVQPGTYNRVLSGATSLSGPAGVLVLQAGQTGFMGLQAAAAPQLLPAAPSFLGGLAAPGGASPAPAAPRSAPRSLQISLRTGDAGGANVVATQPGVPAEQRVRVVEGEPAQLAWSQAAGLPRRGGAGSAAQQVLEVVATVEGGTAQVQLRVQQQGAGPAGTRAEALATRVQLPLGTWTEIGARLAGPRDLVAGTAQAADQRQFLRVDELRP